MSLAGGVRYRLLVRERNVRNKCALREIYVITRYHNV